MPTETPNIQVADANVFTGGSRPFAVNKETGEVRIRTARGLEVNSMLREKEWAGIDAAVLQAALPPMRGIADLRTAGLVVPLGGIGTLVSQWYRSSEITAANVNMTGQGRGERDLPDLDQVGVPIPVVFKEFSIDARTLEASRRLGDGLDTTAAAAAARVVGEGLENMLFNGNASSLNGALLYGYRTHPNRNTDTAANYGGGDWGTIGNITPTVAGMINAAGQDNHFGPYVLYVSQTQYNQAALNFFTDGSGMTGLQRLRQMDGIQDVRMIPAGWLADGELLLIQMDSEVVDWAEALSVTTLEWTSGDGMATMFKVMAIAAPRIKARYDGKSGIVHATGA